MVTTKYTADAQSAFKERPMLFSAPMVRATLREVDPKSQTRRLNGLSHINNDPSDWQLIHCGYLEESRKTYVAVFGNVDGETVTVKSPYGAPGDHLWVRETFCEYPAGNLIFRANYGDGKLSPISDGIGGPWRPSIFMPRLASRINLENTGVRAERLRDISEADAIAEGIEPIRPGDTHLWRNYSGSDYEPEWIEDPMASFFSLWRKINGVESLAANPWLWVTSFRKLAVSR